MQAINLKQIEQISSSAFSSCKDLKSVQLGTYLKKINKRAFGMYSLLSGINLGKIKKIGEKAFSGCSSLEKVDLESVETLEQDAFKGCIGLKEVILPKDEKKAEEIKNLILSQVGANVGKNINFINDSGKN